MFWQALGHTLYFTVMSVIFHLLIGLAFALMLNSERVNPTIRSILRVLYILPWLFTAVIIAIIWRLLLDPEGVVNGVLMSLHIVDFKVEWFSSSNTALHAVTFVNIWAGYPLYMVSLLAGLQGISRDLYEAASIDGANAWQKFRYVTIPQLTPIMISVALLGFHLDDASLRAGVDDDRRRSDLRDRDAQHLYVQARLLALPVLVGVSERGLHSDPVDERDLFLHQASEGEVAAMTRRYLSRTVLPTVLTYVGLAIGLVFAVFPILWMFFASLKSNTEIFALPPQLLPKHFTIAAYLAVFNDPTKIRFFLNSYLVAGAVAVLTVLIGHSRRLRASADFPSGSRTRSTCSSSAPRPFRRSRS